MAMSLRRSDPGIARVVPLPQGKTPSDAALVERALSGDRAAEEAIYLRHVAYVTALCARLLRAPSEVPDIVQDTFADVFGQLGSLRDRARLRHWITGIAVHKAHRRFRRRRLAALFGLAADGDSGADSMAPRAGLSPEHAAELARLDRLLGTLADGDRASWLLRYAEGYSLFETAELCGCSLATVKRRIARADSAVRAHVQLQEPSDG
jgi:RNA polymerase sigma-70 factor, ECF subfamily